MRLEAIEITAGYSRADVLHAVSVSLETGEMVGLIGPNGSGKSTLLRVLSGVLSPTSGRILLDSSSLEKLSAPQRARSIAFVPQSDAIVFDFSVRDIVLMGRYAHDGRGDHPQDFEIAVQAMKETDILSLADRPITSLSGGEQRRALIARALAQQAPMIMLDEPTAHLDITHQADVLNLVRTAVKERGCGAIAALHDLNLAAEFCDRLVLMHDGRAEELTSPTGGSLIEESRLQFAYGTGVRVTENPSTGRPFIYAVPTENPPD